jgi:hypothetical protein
MAPFNIIGLAFFTWLSAPYGLQITIWLLELHGCTVTPKADVPADDDWLLWIFGAAADNPVKHGVAWMVSLVASFV